MVLDCKLRKALIELLQNECIVASWGITNIKVLKSSVDFWVNGMIFKGHVSIRSYDSSNFEYEICFNDNQTFTISLEAMVEFLDKHIERTENYACDIKKYIDHMILR